MRTIDCILRTVALITFISSAMAQTVSIPDPGLNAAIRAALQKPNGPLTDQDLLGLIVLDASSRNVSSIVGLEAARNLVSLDLSVNPLTNCFLPNGLTNLTRFIMEGSPLTHLTLPVDLTGLIVLDLENNQLADFHLPASLTSLVSLDLGFNSLTNFSLPNGLTNLATFYFAGNPLTNVTFPPDLSGLTELNVSQNQLTSFVLPGGMTNLTELDLAFNLLTNLTLPSDLSSLTELELDFNRFTSLSLPTNLASLTFLHLRANLFTNLSLPAGLTGLTYLDLGENQLTNIDLSAGLNHLSTLRLSGNKFTSFTLPPGLTNLSVLFMPLNQLTNLTLPGDLGHLTVLNLGGNQFTSLTLPAGLTNLNQLVLTGNQLINLTLPPDITQLVELDLAGNPLSTLVLSEPLAATNLAATIDSLRSQGVPVFTYPLTIQLIRLRQPIGAFQFAIAGPPGNYTVFSSTNLTTFSVLGTVSNPLGHVNFTDGTAHLSPQKFYRAMLQSPPSNMVFIPPNTFTMGSPTNELHRDPNEGPQTTVTLTHGFWIGKFEVTEGEYLSVTGTNPSEFPGDLSRPISSVTWLDATNYCWLLTQRERAAGRISPDSQYRLPTEAEWECAARAGTSTRFSYGDDPDYTSLTNHAWFLLNSGFPALPTPHPVGQKLPNPWGLYDLEGNVWEWCQDWLGALPGGAVTDPQGPPSNPIGWKVIRGGAYDFDETDCRSARRFFFPATQFHTDTDLGFRVVLTTGPQ